MGEEATVVREVGGAGGPLPCTPPLPIPPPGAGQGVGAWWEAEGNTLLLPSNCDSGLCARES